VQKLRVFRANCVQKMQRGLGMLTDARSLDDERTLDCDLCVVGAGPAGISVVDRLRDSGLSICLLEGGGFEPDIGAQRLYAGSTVGRGYWPLHGCRFRMFGGSSNRWGGWCRPFDAIDFERREWVSGSGWPIGPTDLERYERDAATLLELHDARFDLPAWKARLPPALAIEPSDFENVIYQYSPRTNFADLYRRRVAGTPAVHALLHANVTSLDLVPGTNRVAGVRARTLTGRSFSVRARVTVLAAGGIENARLLLASTRDRPAGVGNEHGLVGRFFMEHLHVPVGYLLPASGTTDWGFYLRRNGSGPDVRGAIAPTAGAQRRRRLLGTSIVIEPARYVTGTPFLGAPPELTIPVARAYSRLRRGRMARLAERARFAAERGWHNWRYLLTAIEERSVRGRLPSLQDAPLRALYFRAEQAPDRDNRVVLGRRLDALGVPRVELHWRLREVDTRSIARWLEAFDATARERGLGRVIAPPGDWPEGIDGGPHHMGTTRMASDPKQGVVDADCRVHSSDNLYVVGSSVFPTGGYANPTFMIVALALRLAEHLRGELT
jgi:choline dehydrogenase-like flavoprotein